jgi:hypothetical protein
VYKRKINDDFQATKNRFCIYFHYKRWNGGGDWEGVFKFGLEVRGGALKTRQGDFEMTSGETKEDIDGVVEAKTWEDEAIMKG